MKNDGPSFPFQMAENH